MKKLLNRIEIMITIGGCLVGVIGILAAVRIGIFTGLSFDELSRDPLGTLNASSWLGIFSSGGIVLWSIGWVGLVLSWFYTKGYKDLKVARIVNLGFGIVGFVMYIDDYIMLHDRFLPIYLGINEVVLPVVYFCAVIVLVIVYLRELVGRGLLILGGAFLFLGFSAGIDTLFYQQHVAWEFYLEDGAKFIGIVLWTGFSLFRTDYLFRRRLEKV